MQWFELSLWPCALRLATHPLRVPFSIRAESERRDNRPGRNALKRGPVSNVTRSSSPLPPRPINPMMVEGPPRVTSREEMEMVVLHEWKEVEDVGCRK